ncbi:MAG: disulfide bond formation protein DsbA [Candidatus Saccharibacteria bacterium]|nr:disulfide bond formation protein DsbA [Candidatus Saccharibacteria bacterium]
MEELAMPLAGRDHIRGNKKAPVMLLEYGDYECPFCGKAYYVMRRLLKERGDQLAYSFRNFPLADIHPHALAAALAAEAAGLQKKFWEMHDMLFENQSLLDDEFILTYAEQIGLNMEKFAEDLDSEDVGLRIQEDIDSGIRNEVDSTPTFFINGEAYSGPYDYGILSLIIDQTAAGTKYKAKEYDHGLSHSKQ